VREPLVMRRPGRIPSGTTCEKLVNALDLYPTFLEAAGIKVLASVQLEGVTLVPLM
jgi:arylsulfatase A-like enzyme